MAKNLNFERITDSITDADIDRFLKSAGPNEFKEQVKNAPDQRTKMRFVAGYLIRNNQVTADRLDGHSAKTALPIKAKKTKATAKPVKV